MTAPPRVRLNLLELEGRDVPAWWAVTAPDPGAGSMGSTDATHTGELTPNPDYAADTAGGVVTVWADTAAQAVVKGLAGTIAVTLGSETFDQAFGPDTVGAAADGKAFALAVAGTGVTLALEDMAGFPGAAPDNDYNDRTFSGVSVAPAADPVVPFGSPDWWVWEDPDPINDESAKVTLRVTRPDDGTYHWEYTVTNNSLTSKFASPGLGQFQLSPGNAAVIDAKSLGTDMAGWNTASDSGGVTWWEPCLTDGPYIAIGGTGTFWFDTPAAPITPATGSVSPAGVDGGGDGGTEAAGAPADEDGAGCGCGAMTAESTSGPVNCVLLEPFAAGVAKGPGRSKADIDITGKVLVDNNKVDFDERTEDEIGGLVVKQAADNNAPRKRIIIQKLTDFAAVPNPVVGGRVQVTVAAGADKVELYDVATGGKPLPFDQVYNQNELPKTLYVQGKLESGSMRDIRINVGAVPVQGLTPFLVPDDVTFTTLWSTVTVKGGSIDRVSTDNGKRGYWNISQRYNDNKLADHLGPRPYGSDTGKRNVFAWGFEAKAVISPSNFQYPGVPTILGSGSIAGMRCSVG